MLSVYTRHHPDCRNAGDKTWRRCCCPKWIWGSLNGKFIRQSAKTPRWEEAEELRRQLSESLLPANRPATQPDLSIDALVPMPRGRKRPGWKKEFLQTLSEAAKDIGEISEEEIQRTIRSYREESRIPEITVAAEV